MKSKEIISSPYGLKVINRNVVKLSELCSDKDGIQTGPFGSQLHNSDYVAEGTPIITVEHLGENVIDAVNAPRVHADDVARLSKYTLQTGDIVFSRVGSVDRRALVSPRENGWMFSGRLLRIRPNLEKVDATYLSYFFGLTTFKSYIRSIAVGATMPSLNTDLLANIPIFVPSIQEQQAIGMTLSCIDEKIRSNQILSKTLEEIAQTIFKSWFIDFDPVKAKMAGEKPVDMDDATAALFPDLMQDSELGPIPVGWSVSTLKEFAPFVYGKALKADLRQEGTVPVYGSNGVVGVHNDSLTNSSAVIIGRKGTVGTVNLCLQPAWIIDTGYFSIPVDASDVYLTYFSLKTLGLEKMNSDAAVPGLNRDEAHRQKILVGDAAIRKRFSEVVGLLFAQVSSLQEQSKLLFETRDRLLPRLISGELQISEEMMVES